MPQTHLASSYKSSPPVPSFTLGLTGKALLLPESLAWERGGEAGIPSPFDAPSASSTLMMLGEAVSVMKTLTSELRLLREELALHRAGESVGEAREFPSEEGKAALLAWYQTHPGEHFPSDVAQELGMDFVQARDLTAELKAEGALR